MSNSIVNQIGNNATADSPFVTARDVVYFRGTDDKLWRVNGDGDPTSQWQIGTNTTKSTPFVFDDPATGKEWVYFQGTGHARRDYLWKVQADRLGTELTHIGTNKTASTPFVFADPNGDVKVYFEGTDHDQLWKVNSDPSGSGLTQFGNNYTKSPPFVFRDPTGDWVYFQGTDDRLLRVKTNGADGTWLGGNYTKSSPFVAKDPTGDIWVYFQGTDDRLLRVRSDGTRPEDAGKPQFAGIYTKSTPFVTNEGWVYFQVRGPWGGSDKGWLDGPLGRVFCDGSQLTGLTDFTIASSPKVGRMQIANGTLGEWVYFQATGDGLYRYFQPANPLATGTVRPKFYVLTVLYAPPGTNGGKSVSLVDYSSESATGTKTSIATSVKQGVSATFGGEKKGGLEFEFSETDTDSSSVEIKKSTTFDIKLPGPAKDGIDHDHDVFVLMLNPLLNVTIYSGNQLVWTLDVDGPVMNIQYVYAGWLSNHSTMPPGVKAQLDAAGLEASDYQTILSTNPFATGASAIDADRFLPTPQSFAYEPPYSCKDAPWTETLKLENTATGTSKSEVKYSVSAKLSLPFDVFKLGGSVEWTSTNSTETSTESKQSAAVTVGGPAFGYTGPTDVLVYWDTVFNSFMFAFPDGPSTAALSSASAAGRRTRPAGSHQSTRASR
jgi:hypothetical protein